MSFIDNPVKRIGWKTFRGMVLQLKRQNKQLKRLRCRARFIVELPLKD